MRSKLTPCPCFASQSKKQEAFEEQLKFSASSTFSAPSLAPLLGPADHPLLLALPLPRAQRTTSVRSTRTRYRSSTA